MQSQENKYVVEAETHPTQYSNINAKQKHLGCKKVWGQSEATLQTGSRDQKV